MHTCTYLAIAGDGEPDEKRRSLQKLRVEQEIYYAKKFRKIYPLWEENEKLPEGVLKDSDSGSARNQGNLKAQTAEETCHGNGGASSQRGWDVRDEDGHDDDVCDESVHGSDKGLGSKTHGGGGEGCVPHSSKATSGAVKDGSESSNSAGGSGGGGGGDKCWDFLHKGKDEDARRNARLMQEYMQCARASSEIFEQSMWMKLGKSAGSQVADKKKVRMPSSMCMYVYGNVYVYKVLDCK